MLASRFARDAGDRDTGAGPRAPMVALAGGLLGLMALAWVMHGFDFNRFRSILW